MRRISIRSLPIPRIMTGTASRALLAERSAARFLHQDAHALDGTVEAAEDRLADEKMADVELDDGRDRRDRTDRVESEAMPRVAFKAQHLGMTRRENDPRQFRAAARRVTGIERRLAISAGMKLDHRRAEALCHVELL